MKFHSKFQAMKLENETKVYPKSEFKASKELKILYLRIAQLTDSQNTGTSSTLVLKTHNRKR